MLDLWEKQQRFRTNQIVLRFLETLTDLYELKIIPDRGKFKIQDLQFENVYLEHNFNDRNASKIYYDTLADVLYRLSGSFLESYILEDIERCERDWDDVPPWDYLAVEYTNSPIIHEILHDITPNEYKKITTNDDTRVRMETYWRMNVCREIKPILYPNEKEEWQQNE